MTTPNDEIKSMLADLNAAFGKKARVKKEPSDADIRKERNQKWHAANAPLPQGAISQRPNPEDSHAWRPVAKVTHVCIQECSTCSDAIEYIAGEYVKFLSILGLNGGEVLRRTEHCPSLFLYDSIEEPLEDILEWHYVKVERCSGCIRVEQAAQARLWDEQLRAQLKAIQPSLDLDLGAEIPRTLDDAFKEEA